MLIRLLLDIFVADCYSGVCTTDLLRQHRGILWVFFDFFDWCSNIRCALCHRDPRSMHVLLRVQGDRRIVSFGYVVGLLNVQRCRWPPECVSFDPKDPFESLTCVKVQDL